MAFYDIFEKLCNEKGVTPTQAGRDNGIAQGVVSMWKKRGSTPKAETVQKLADYFGVAPRDLTDCDSFSVSFTVPIEELQSSMTTLLWGSNIHKQVSKTLDILNESGRRKVSEYALDIAGNPEYRRQEAPESALDSTEGEDTAPPLDAPETPPEGPEEGGENR